MKIYFEVFLFIFLNKTTYSLFSELEKVAYFTFYSYYSRSSNIVRVIKSRRLRWAGHVDRMEEGRNAFKILTGKPTGKRPLWRPRHRWG